MPRYAFPDPFDELTTPQITALLVDERGIGIGSGTLEALTLTLYNLDDPAAAIINGRNKQNVLNLQGVTVDASGNLVWTLQQNDLAIQDDTLVIERHLALFEWTWSTGTKYGKQELLLRVRNLSKVP